MARATTIRLGKAVPTDAVFDAWTSGDLNRMLAVVNHPTNLIERHFLLLGICDQYYRLRTDPRMGTEFARFSELHISEFKKIAPTLAAQHGGVIPRVPTFQNYSTYLAENGDYDRAIRVCEVALQFGLTDGTKAGFQGRIDKIKKKAARE